MKKIFLGFIRICVAIVLILLAASALTAVISLLGTFICVLTLLFFILTAPISLYQFLTKPKKT
ncbi:hypothetical protein ACMDB5_13110 [Flavobacterium sp. W1B]|uniref:hypothetical protein n=1 Tax=Flavobacterium sp. W1B TaxID=3394146 RepID=UPI0039BCA3C3